MVEGTSLYSIWSLWNIVVHTRRSNLVLNDLSNWMRRSKDYNLGGWLAGCVFNNFFDRILGVFSWGTFLSLTTFWQILTWKSFFSSYQKKILQTTSFSGLFLLFFSYFLFDSSAYAIPFRLRKHFWKEVYEIKTKNWIWLTIHIGISRLYIVCPLRPVAKLRTHLGRYITETFWIGINQEHNFPCIQNSLYD